MNGSNFTLWKRSTEFFLKSKRLWIHFKPTTEKEREAYPNWAEDDEVALAYVGSRIEPALSAIIQDCPTALEAWTKLESIYQSSNLNNLISLSSALFSKKLEQGENLQNHILFLKETFDQIKQVKTKASSETLFLNAILLKSLPPEYKPLCLSFESWADTDLTWEKVTARVLQEGENLKQFSVETSFSMSAKREVPYCQHCRKAGHAEKDCRYKNSKVHCLYCERVGHSEENCHKKAYDQMKKLNLGKRAIENANFTEEHQSLELAFNVQESGVPQKETIIDSGATSHMTSQRTAVVNVRISATKFVLLGDQKTQLKVTGVGDWHLKTIDGTVILTDTLIVPELGKNLISVSKLLNEKFKISTERKNLVALKADGSRIVANSSGNLFKVEMHEANLVMKREDESIASLWHRRLGHICQSKMEETSEAVTGFNKPALLPYKCVVCLEAKAQRNSFPRKSETNTTETLELIHCDLKGPANITGRKGNRYFITFTDDFSRFSCIVLLKEKSQASEALRKYIAFAENAQGRRIKAIRADNGGEFVNQEFEDILAEKGISRQRTAANSPQQNGVAERLNRTLGEKAKALLFQSDLPKSFWEDSVTHATYLHNITVHSACSGKTPFELWNGKKPSLENLVVFGARGLATIPVEQRKFLEKNTIECKFLGFPSGTKNTYKLWNVQTKREITSHSVVFDESATKADDKTQEKEDLVPLGDFDSDLPDVAYPSPNPKPSQETRPQEETHAEAVEGRPKREIKRPDYYQMTSYNVCTEQTDKIPQTIAEARQMQNADEWETACMKELESMKTLQVYSLTTLPEGRTAIQAKWVFDRKSSGIAKARLVAKGYSQRAGVDYHQTFAPTARFESVRLLLSMAAEKKWKILQLDVSTAFLNADLKEEIYLCQPEGFKDSKNPHLVWRLHKAIYGLKQAPREWNLRISSFFQSIDFSQMKSDNSIFVKRIEGELAVILLYVDDLLIFGTCQNLLLELKKQLCAEFKMNDMEGNEFVGLQIQREENGSITIHQKKFIQELIGKTNFERTNCCSTPLEPNTQLPEEDLAPSREDQEFMEDKPYSSVVGSLNYLAHATRPDIAFATHQLSRHLNSARKKHWLALERVLSYLAKTADLAITYQVSSSTPGKLIGYSDANWGGEREDPHSISAFVFLLNDGILSWSCKTQSTIARSTCEAEYVALDHCNRNAIWLKSLTEEMGFPSQALQIFGDNLSSLMLAKNPEFHQKTKHINIKYHAIRESITAGQIELQHVGTEFMCADPLTKALYRPAFLKFIKAWGISALRGDVDHKA